MVFFGTKDNSGKENKPNNSAKRNSNDQKNTKKITFCYGVTIPSALKKDIFQKEMARYHDKIDTSESLDNALNSIQTLIPDSFQQLIPASILKSISDSIQDLQSEDEILDSKLVDEGSNVAEYLFIIAYLILEAKVYAYEKFPPSEATDSVTEQFMSFPAICEKIFSADHVPAWFLEYGLNPAEDSQKIQDRSLSLIENLLNEPESPQCS